MHIYRSSSKDCRHCPLRTACIGKSDFKAMTHSVDKQHYDTMHDRLQTPRGKAIMKRRSSTVEPVLGTLVNFMGMKRINARGIQAANKHVMMALIAYNLKKYLKTTRKRMKVLALSMEMPKMPVGTGLLPVFWPLLALLWPLGLHHSPKDLNYR